MKTRYKLLVLLNLVALTSCQSPTSSEALVSSEPSKSESEASSSSSSISESISSEDIGYYKSELKYTTQAISSHYAPTLGDQDLLVVPISLSGKTAYSWSSYNLDLVRTCYFGPKIETPSSWNSLATYYNTASLGKMNLQGEVIDPYESTYTREDLYTDDKQTNKNNTLEIIKGAVEYAASKVNLDDYDRNDDGFIDSIHFIFDDSDGNEWGSALWPQMGNTLFSPGTISAPSVFTYSLTNVGVFTSARLAVHEQGHIFGLQDYYDYNPDANGADPVGKADMQSQSCFDWNSFSKMSVGWIDPYYVDGSKDSVEITINTTATSGDAIVIANNWNHTAFDEYILLELFAPAGNNKNDWTSWNNNPSKFTSLGSRGGVRLYHVDARIWGYDDGNFAGGEIVDDITTSSHPYHQIAVNNSTNDTYAYQKPEGMENYNLLHLIQKGGTNTFVKADGRHTLAYNDMFRTGDSFSLEKYGEEFFPNKTKFNNGDDFPYVIDFLEVSNESAKIRITKI